MNEQQIIYTPPEGQKLLKVTGIIMLIFGILSIIFSVLPTLGAMSELSEFYGQSKGVNDYIALINISFLLVLVFTGLQFTCGILGIKFSINRKKAKLCLIFASIYIFFILVTDIATPLYIGSNSEMINAVANIGIDISSLTNIDFVGIVVSSILPGLFLLGAYQNLNS